MIRAPLSWSYPRSPEPVSVSSHLTPLTPAFPGHKAGRGLSLLLSLRAKRSTLTSLEAEVCFLSVQFKSNTRRRDGAGMQGRERQGEGTRRLPKAQMGSRTDPSQGGQRTYRLHKGNCPAPSVAFVRDKRPAVMLRAGRASLRERGKREGSLFAGSDTSQPSCRHS